MWEPPDGEEFIEQGVSPRWLKARNKIEPFKLQSKRYAREYEYWWFSDSLWKTVTDDWAIKLSEVSEEEL